MVNWDRIYNSMFGSVNTLCNKIKKLLSNLNSLENGNYSFNEQDKIGLFQLQEKIKDNKRMSPNQKKDLLKRIDLTIKKIIQYEMNLYTELLEVYQNGIKSDTDIFRKCANYFSDTVIENNLMMDSYIKLNYDKIFAMLFALKMKKCDNISFKEKADFNDLMIIAIDKLIASKRYADFLDKLVKVNPDYIIIIFKIAIKNNKSFIELQNWLSNHPEIISEKVKRAFNDSLHRPLTMEIIEEFYQEIKSNTPNLEHLKNLSNSFDVMCEDSINIFGFRKLRTIMYLLSQKKNLFKNQEMYEEVLENMSQKFHTMMSKEPNNMARRNIVFDKVDFRRRYDEAFYRTVQTEMEDAPVISNKHIMVIDNMLCKDIDKAFSIECQKDYYILDLYVSDVPSFLNNNRNLARVAYQNGLTYYSPVKHRNICYTIDMIPPRFSHDLLSLSGDGLKNVITFRFVFYKDGFLKNVSLSKNKIKVNSFITPDDVVNIENVESEKVKKDLGVLQEIYDKVSSYIDLTSLVSNKEDTNKLITFPEALANYYIAVNADLAIYQKDGMYTKEKSNYTNSVSPLKNYVSNINLALFLYQKGLLCLAPRDIYLIRKHLDEMVQKFNMQEEIREYIKTQKREMRKFLNLENGGL